MASAEQLAGDRGHEGELLPRDLLVEAPAAEPAPRAHPHAPGPPTDCCLDAVAAEGDGDDPRLVVTAAAEPGAEPEVEAATEPGADPQAPSRPPAPSGGHVTSTVHVNGAVTGALAARLGPDRSWGRHDERLLVTFAEHVSMALTDARTVAAVDEAFHDPLTDLPNRALFLGRLEAALAAKGDDDVAVLFVDLDLDLEDILAQLTWDGPLRDAVRQGATHVGDIVADVIACQLGGRVGRIGLSDLSLHAASVEAL